MHGLMNCSTSHPKIDQVKLIVFFLFTWENLLIGLIFFSSDIFKAGITQNTILALTYTH